jgi:hypothetical protein
MESTDTRTLRLEIPSCVLVKGAPDPTWTTTTGINGWQITTPGFLGVHWEGTIDLSGYVRDMKTFYPSAGMTQQGPFVSEVGGSGNIMYTIISTIPLNAEVLFTQVVNMNGGPGFLNNAAVAPGDQQNWETVIFAESQIYVPNTSLTPNPVGLNQLLSSNQTGSLSPTAANTLYVMKFVFPFGALSTSLEIPASRVILPGKFGIEPDVEYMMRLKRSTELANQV